MEDESKIGEASSNEKSTEEKGLPITLSRLMTDHITLIVTRELSGKFEGKINQVAAGIVRMEEKVGGINDKIEEMERRLFGNGQPGHEQRIAQLELGRAARQAADAAKHKTSQANWQKAGVITAVLLSIVSMAVNAAMALLKHK